MGGESADLSVQILQLALVGGLDVGQRIASLKYVRQALEGGLLPVTQDGGVNAILRRELTNGFGFLQQLQHNLGFEGGSVRFFHVAILPNAGVLTVQILGSTIKHRRTFRDNALPCQLLHPRIREVEILLPRHAVF